mgnify:CR=1 FL=1
MPGEDEPIAVEPLPDDGEELIEVEVVPDEEPAPAPAQRREQESPSTSTPPPAVSSGPGKRPEFGTQEFGRKKDWFLTYEDRNRVWTAIADDMGDLWDRLSRPEKEAAVAKYTDRVIDEVIAMAGGIWGEISLEKKRELFHARFIDKTVAPSGREQALKGPEKKEEFPDMDNWFLKNRHMMVGMNLAERTALYKTGKSKWQVAAAKAKGPDKK